MLRKNKDLFLILMTNSRKGSGQRNVSLRKPEKKKKKLKKNVIHKDPKKEKTSSFSKEYSQRKDTES